MREIWVRSLDWEDPLEEGMATHSSILTWRISMDRGVWVVTVHGVAKSDTTERLSTVQGLHHNLLPSETYHSRVQFLNIIHSTRVQFQRVSHLSKTYFTLAQCLDLLIS